MMDREKFWIGLGAEKEGYYKDGDWRRYYKLRDNTTIGIQNDTGGIDWRDPHEDTFFIRLEVLLDGLEGLVVNDQETRGNTVELTYLKGAYGVLVGLMTASGLFTRWRIDNYGDRRAAIIAAICKLLGIEVEDAT